MLSSSNIYSANITDYTADGMGVAHVDGCAVFIPNAIFGEEYKIRIVHISKNKAIGKIEEICTKSPHRINRDCPWSKICGGCDFRHMDYIEETRLKVQRVSDTLKRIGGWQPEELPISSAEDIIGYRNKAIFPVSIVQGKPEAGFYRARTHTVIPITNCLLQNNQANIVRKIVIDFLRKYHISVYDEAQHKGLVRHIFVRSADATGQVMVCLIINGRKLPHEAEFCDSLRKAIPEITSILLCSNEQQGNSVMSDKIRILWGTDTIEDVLCGLRFRLSARSFYQVNRAQAEILYGVVQKMADLDKTDTLLDLYCGTGTITLHLARQAGQAIGVEIVPSAIEDAKKNATRNGIENVRFFCEDASDAAKRFLSENIFPDVVVVDPPRKGLARDVIDTIVQMSPSRIVYVSCDPATLARDISCFQSLGFKPNRAECVDLFPRCAHVETVVLMSRADAKV